MSNHADNSSLRKVASVVSEIGQKSWLDCGPQGREFETPEEQQRIQTRAQKQEVPSQPDMDGELDLTPEEHLLVIILRVVDV